jgi:hypothetical protein
MFEAHIGLWNKFFRADDAGIRKMDLNLGRPGSLWGFTPFNSSQKTSAADLTGVSPFINDDTLESIYPEIATSVMPFVEIMEVVPKIQMPKISTK